VRRPAHAPGAWPPLAVSHHAVGVDHRVCAQPRGWPRPPARRTPNGCGSGGGGLTRPHSHTDHKDGGKHTFTHINWFRHSETHPDRRDCPGGGLGCSNTPPPHWHPHRPSPGTIRHPTHTRTLRPRAGASTRWEMEGNTARERKPRAVSPSGKAGGGELLLRVCAFFLFFSFFDFGHADKIWGMLITISYTPSDKSPLPLFVPRRSRSPPPSICVETEGGKAKKN